jgi:signal transduction histidine kinase
MSFERLSAAVRSLRFRLMLWNVAAGVLTGLGILIAVREGVRLTLIAELDQVLREDLKEIQLYFQGPSDYNWALLQEELDRKSSGHDFHGWFVQFYDDQGQVAWASKSAPSLPVLAPQQKAAGQFRIDQFRLQYARLPEQVEQAAAVAVGCNEQFIARDMSRIDRLVMTVGGVIVLVAPIGGYLLAGRTTRILANLIHTTDRLRPSELKERLPIRGTGDELDAMARTINGLLDRIADYLKQKHDFLANAAHELRTPLAAIRSSVEVALSGERSEQEYRELLDVVIDQCTALEALVNQLLLLAESDADRLMTNSEATSLDEVVKRAVEMFEGVAEDRGIELSYNWPPPIRVVGNRHRLRQLLNNLLDNAIKYTAASHPPPAGTGDEQPLGAGRVAVQLVRDEASQTARLTIHDNGIGISSEALPHVFERFYRGDRARTREGTTGGTGLGLSICQAIVLAHHGSISAISSAHEGTTFAVELPLAMQVDVPADRQADEQRRLTTAGAAATRPGLSTRPS